MDGGAGGGGSLGPRELELGSTKKKRCKRDCLGIGSTRVLGDLGGVTSG
jgi:hypothetical protein